MKKCTLILMVILTITACKKEKEDSPALTIATNVGKTVPLSDCITLEGYYKLSHVKEKAEWLRQRGDSVCECTLEEAVLYDHEVKGTVSDQKEKYVRTWGDLKKIIGTHGYDAYLNIDYSGDKITGLKLVYRYIPEDNGTYYRFSTVLIKSLAKKHAKDDNTEFQFSFATTDNSAERVVVIQVNENSGNGQSANATPYYDYSTDPKLIDEFPTLHIPL